MNGVHTYVACMKLMYIWVHAFMAAAVRSEETQELKECAKWETSYIFKQIESIFYNSKLNLFSVFQFNSIVLATDLLIFQIENHWKSNS